MTFMQYFPAVSSLILRQKTLKKSRSVSYFSVRTFPINCDMTFMKFSPAVSNLPLCQETAAKCSQQIERKKFKPVLILMLMKVVDYLFQLPFRSLNLSILECRTSL